MIQRVLLVAFAALCLNQGLLAQTEEEKKTMAAKEAAAKADMGWKKGGSIGFDMAGLALVNPRLGAGTNSFGLGGQLDLFASHKGAKTFWDNRVLLLLRTVRVGGKDEPFQKSADLLRLNSRYGYSIIGDKIYVAIDGQAETQTLPTYTGSLLSGDDDDLLSEFLSPLRIQLSPGIAYRRNEHISFFVSPISLNFIYVHNDSLAVLPNQPLGNEFGKNNRTQLGYIFKAAYNNKYFNDRLAVNSQVAWFADYRQNLNGNVTWQNTFDVQIVKGLSLSLFGELFYDHFSLAQIETPPAGTKPEDLGPYLGLRPSYRGTFLLKYSRIF